MALKSPLHHITYPSYRFIQSKWLYDIFQATAQRCFVEICHLRLSANGLDAKEK